VAAGERLAGRTHVLDGDTIVVSGIHIRLKGVAARKVVHPGADGEPGGEEAKAFMVELPEGQTAVCDLTRERTHGRRVGRCYRDGQDVAKALIKAGPARELPAVQQGALCGCGARCDGGPAVSGLLPDPVGAGGARAPHRGTK
jgi:endonuclease YncB( thermonuclease family)